MVTNNHETSTSLALSLCVCVCVCFSGPNTSVDTLFNLQHTQRYNSTNEMEDRDKKTIDWMMVMNGIDDWIDE